MPSFLTDENSPVYSHSSGILHLGPEKDHDIAQGKPLRQIHPYTQSHHSNASLEEKSTHSTQNSDLSDAGPQVDGGGSPPPPASMSSLPNGILDDSQDKNGRTVPARKPLPNGTSIVGLVDRTVAQQPATNGSRKSDSPEPSPRDVPPRISQSSTGGGSIQPSPVEMYIKSVGKGEVSTVDNTASGPSRLPPTTASAPGAHPTITPISLSTAAPSLDSTPHQRSAHSPHRFSSPPQYYPGGATPSTAAGTPALPAGLIPPSGLKHRHTLEVPKLAPGRGSRDGIDSALSAGRFSPTTATAPGARRASLSLVRRNTRSIHSDMPRDEVVPDEDALRWAEAYRQKRASKRKRREEVDEDRVLVGTKVDESHANWVTAYNMLTGIRVSVSRTNAKLDRPLTDADFETKQKSTFDIAGNELVPSAKYDFKFKDYAPWVFRHLRTLFRLDPADYLMSLTGKYILSELGSPGKSGSFFYFSRDYKYIIKTIHRTEHKFFRKILREYYQHVTDNPNTLLSQFYGLHRVKMPYGKKIHFVVMNNLFPPHLDIHQTFDLKGSTIGRNYKEEDLEKNPRATMKDLNWLRRRQHLELGLKKKQLFLEQLQKDIRLLQRLGIMDYSLLVGIHDQQRGNEEKLRDRMLQVFSPGGDVRPEGFDPHSVLMRTPSKLENARKARELRQMIKAERPVPMGQTGSRMPDELDEGRNRPGFIFYEDDGGFRATHEDNSPANEIYYLGVIDCLTHYGMIKKIEHFWKGLSNDRMQISAMPPSQYADRFMNFISGTTMSPEEVEREAREKEAAEAASAAAAAAATAAATGPSGAVREKDRITSWGSTARRRSTAQVAAVATPPVPSHQSPQPLSSMQSPPLPSGQKSPEAEETIRRAEQVARYTELQGAREEDVPERVLKTTSMPAAVAVPSSHAGSGAGGPPATAASGGVGTSSSSSSSAAADRRESAMATQTPILPIVEEVGEASSVGSGSRNGGSREGESPGDNSGLRPTQQRPRSNVDDGDYDYFHNQSLRTSRTESDGRPLTPAKDGEEMSPGFGNPVMSGGGGAGSPLRGRPPPTPPKTGYLKKPDSVDSGYGVGAVGAGASTSGGATGGGLASLSGSQRSQGSGGRAVRNQVSRESLDKALPPLPKVTQRIDEDGERVIRIGIS